jgi:MFS family permease
MQNYHDHQGEAYMDTPGAYKDQQRIKSQVIEVAYDNSISSPSRSPAISAMKPEKRPPIKMSVGREVLFVGIVAIAHFMTQCALGQALVPLDIIGHTFKVNNMGQSSWFVAGYSLTVGTFILISGRMGDIMGHKRVFCFGWAWFGMWSAFAGFAAFPQNMIFFDICRALQGIGPAIIMPTGLALFGLAYPPGLKKNIVFSIFGAVAPAGFVTGAVFGSLFAQGVWWPWAFWTFAITCWLLCALAIMVIPRELSYRPLGARVPHFDWTGSFLGVTGLILFNVAWNAAPMYGWGSPRVYFLLILGLVFLGAFIWFEKRAKDPILPISCLNSTVLYVLGCVGIGWGAFGVWVFYSFRFMQSVRHYSPLQSAAAFGPAPIAGLLASGLTGFMLTHTPVSFTMMISMLAFFIGIVIAATQPIHQTYWAQMFVSVVVMPFGMDMSFPAATVLLSNRMPPEHQGIAASLVNTVVNYFISISLGIAGTVEVNIAKQGPGVDPTDINFLMKGYRSAFYTAIGLSGAGVVCGMLFFIKEYRREGWKVMDH